MAYPLSKKLPLSLMGWKPSTRGVGLDMVRRTGKAIGIRLSRVGGYGGGQSYLEFRMLAWPLVQEEVTARVLSQNKVPRRRREVGVMLGRYQQSSES